MLDEVIIVIKRLPHQRMPKYQVLSTDPLPKEWNQNTEFHGEPVDFDPNDEPWFHMLPRRYPSSLQAAQDKDI